MKKVSLSLIVDGEERDNRDFIEWEKFAYDKCIGMYKQLIDIVRVNNYAPSEIITKIEELKEKEA